MAKVYSEFVCQQCGYKSPSFLGKCPNCGEWNSLVETTAVSQPGGGKPLNIELIRLSEVKSEHLKRTSAGFSEFDRVLGGGIVPGSIVLIAGDPGIGKSTLLLQSAMQIAAGPVASFPPAPSINSGQALLRVYPEQSRRAVVSPSTPATRNKLPNNPTIQQSNYPNVLYVTGEESAQQVKIRAQRIGKRCENLFILPQIEVEAIVEAASRLKPNFLIVDSIQTITTSRLSGSAGSVGQVRECAQVLQRYAKETQTPIFLVGHVTKEGSVAGPKVLEHLVDAVLALEGENTHAFRLLRSVKNRFGSTSEVGVFEMTDAGLIEVENPSKIFLSQRIKNRPGSAVCATIAGGRPILAEVQALCTSTIFGVPTRRVTGLDFSRMQIVIASLSRTVSIPFGNLDIYLNVAGGLKIIEPAADLPAALAIVSAARGKPLKEGICVFGEVGLLGELRPVGYLKNRASEAKRLGFSDFVTPERFKMLEEAISYALGK